MRIALVTQADPFYLADNLRYLFQLLPKDMRIVAAFVTKPSPFGQRKNFFSKALSTVKTFGFRFFCYYSFLYIINCFRKSKDVNKLLKDNSIKVINLKNSINSAESIRNIKELNVDILISILGTDIFKSEFLQSTKYGCLNLHTSLLPKYRGLMPTFWVMKNNEKYTGVSVFMVDQGIDSGPIISQQKVEIGMSTQKELIQKTKKIGMELIVDALIKIKNNNVKFITNPDEEKSYFSFPTRKDVLQFKRIKKKFY